MTNRSLKELNNNLIEKQSTWIHPDPYPGSKYKNFQDLESLINDMRELRNLTPIPPEDDICFKKYEYYESTMSSCTCNTRVEVLPCLCNTVTNCSCNTRSGGIACCVCNGRSLCYCHSRDQCSCLSRSWPGEPDCYCNTRHSGCGCGCNNRTGCDCYSRNSTCVSRTGTECSARIAENADVFE